MRKNGYGGTYWAVSGPSEPLRDLLGALLDPLWACGCPQEEMKANDNKAVQLTSWKHYSNTKSFAHNLQNFGIRDTFQAWVKLNCDFLSDQLNNFAVINIMHTWVLKVRGRSMN